MQGQYYGVQGTNWKAPPILDNPATTTRMRGRKYELFYDGNRLRLVAWRTPRGVYWVSNTLLADARRTGRCSRSPGRWPGRPLIGSAAGAALIAS